VFDEKIKKEEKNCSFTKTKNPRSEEQGFFG
jgi:hypothetical protein